MTKEARIYNGEKTVSSISGAGKTGQLHVHYKTIKFLEEKIGRTLFDINHSKIFHDPPLRAMEIKTKLNKWDLMKLKSFCTAKETINKTKRQP